MRQSFRVVNGDFVPRCKMSTIQLQIKDVVAVGGLVMHCTPGIRREIYYCIIPG